MFVRVKKIGAYEYLYLVENAREGGRHVQRVIKALGRRDEVEASGLIDGLIASAARHSRRTIVLSSFYRGELPELRRVRIGPVLWCGGVWAAGWRRILLVRVKNAPRLIRQGVVRDGMIPKLRSCARTLARDVREIDILPPSVPGALLEAFKTGQHPGTRIVSG